MRSVRGLLEPAEWRRLGAFYAVILAFHLAGFGMLVLLIAPRYPALSITVGITAWTLGMRHAFDADHISAIDNTTRKLMADGGRPLGVGFFFSLGHSSVVLVISTSLAVAAREIAGTFCDGCGNTALRSTGAFIGTTVSGTFLYLIAALNLVILLGIVRVFRDMRRGIYDEHQLEAQLQSRGFLNRFFGPLARSVRHSWQLYFVGVLFGLGFDTASEIAVFGIAAGAATQGLPIYATITFPLLFTAGMTLLDTADGAFMSQAYGWAFSKPVRKVYYNIAITGLSVAVALIIGTIELLGVLATRLGLEGGFWGFVGNVNNDINLIGFIIVGLFVVTWIGALAIWRYGRIEEKWALTPSPVAVAPDISAREPAS
jgi:high-affinity nickel-transport protein